MDIDVHFEQLDLHVTDDSISCEAGELEYSYDGNEAIVNSISVRKTRQGVGTKLVQYFEFLTRKESIHRVFVPASPTKEAILFWKSLGYKPSTDDDASWTKKIANSYKESSWDTPQGVVVLRKTI